MFESLVRRVLIAFAVALSLFAMPDCGSSGSPPSVKRSASRASAVSDQELVPIGAGLKGPPGLHAVVYAKGPPTLAAFAFDSQGRLWLSAAGLESHTHDGVYLIEGPGRAARKVVGGLDYPLGLDWWHGRLYVASLGRVDVFEGYDGHRFARRRTLIKGPLQQGENNLLVQTSDGHFLMGVSASCDHCVPTSKWDGAIVSFGPNGEDLRVYARRIRAPIGLAYLPGTDDLFVTMNQQDNLGAETPGDELASVRQGDSWRFPECHEQAGPQCAGVPPPVASLDKHAAVGGLAFAAGRLGPRVGTAAIVAEWNVGRVLQVALRRDGPRFRGTVGPFIEGIARPLAVSFAPSRALLVGDWETGTIYSIAP